MPMRKCTLFSCTLSLWAAILSPLFFFEETEAQQKKKALTLERIFGTEQPSLSGELPKGIQWLPGGEAFFFLKKDPKDKKTKLWKFRVSNGECTLFLDPQRLQEAYKKAARTAEEKEASLPLSDFSFTPDWNHMIFIFMGDLYFYTPETSIMRRLTATPAPEEHATSSPDGKYIAYTREKNLYALEVGTGLEIQLTADGGGEILNGHHSWVYYEEVFDREYKAFWWSPDSRRIAFYRYDESPVFTMTMVDLIPIAAQPVLQRYPKAGGKDPLVQLGIVSLADGKTVWVDTMKDAEDYIVWAKWTPEGDALGVQVLNRDQTRIGFFLADPDTGKVRLVLEERQKEWVGSRGSMRFLKDGSHFLWPSDRDGWTHLYLYDRNGNLACRLTGGRWSVDRLAGIQESKGFIYFTANEKSTLERHLYRVRLDGSGFRRLSAGEGTHTIDMPEEGTCYLDTFSTIASPGRVDLYDDEGKKLYSVEENPAEELKEYGLTPPGFFHFETEDGAVLPGWLLRPAHMSEGRKYPVLIAIYGGPGSQSVANQWEGTSGLWYQYLAQKGIAVAAIDHRGTAHFGKEGAVRMHRRLGYWEVKDYVSGVKFLASLGFIDPKRVAIWGWSYGGYAACISMVKAPETFSVGVAVAPVTHWANYDTIYTEALMDTPKENPEGYRESSPITHAARLKGRLLIVHGTQDDNVHFQNSVQFVNALIHEGKPVDVMYYPNRGHSIYKDNARPHLFRKITGYLMHHLEAEEGKPFEVF